MPASRSFCTRSSMITSVPRSASSMCRVMRNPGASVAATSGTNSGGPHSVIFAPNLREQVARRARHPAVKDVADDRDLQPLSVFLCFRIV